MNRIILAFTNIKILINYILKLIFDVEKFCLILSSSLLFSNKNWIVGYRDVYSTS